VATVLDMRSLATGSYVVPRWTLHSEATSRPRARVAQFDEVVSLPFTIDPEATLTNFDLVVPEPAP
jgi:hypothetical protein